LCSDPGIVEKPDVAYAHSIFLGTPSSEQRELEQWSGRRDTIKMMKGMWSVDETYTYEK
jgi:hypothetical protein